MLKAEAGYHTAMAGKWHLGSAQRKLTPTGKGFDEFTGMYMWDLDSYTKQMYGAPWPPPLMIDWVREHRNGTFYHYAEPMHATDAITEAAIEHIRTHAAHHDEGLFLYVAFTAAHSPLQPQSRHTHVCRHIVNSWRRDFCGMVVGADEAVATIINAARKALGDELLVVLTSDNGGSTWFGGMNAPLRGSKATPLEGGTRVPAILLDYTPEQKYIGYRGSDWEKEGQRIYNGLFHVSDWMPTLLSLAGVSNDRWPAHMDGLDFSAIFHDVPYTPLTSPSLYLNVTYGYTFSARSEVLYELYLQEEFLFREALSAYRIGSYKLIDGPVRDPHYYFESSAGQVNSSDPSPFAKGLTELGIRLGDAVFGLAPFDQLRTFLTFGNLHSVYTARQRTRQDTLRLFDLATDPLETTNLASLPQYTHIVAQLRSRIEKIKANRPTPIQKAYLQLPLDEVWSKMHVPGNCSMNPAIQPRDCRFIHPWIPDVSHARVYLDMLSLFFLFLLMTFLVYVSCAKRMPTPGLTRAY